MKTIKLFEHFTGPDDMSIDKKYTKDEVTSLCWKLFPKVRSGEIKDWVELNSYIENELR